MSRTLCSTGIALECGCLKGSWSLMLCGVCRCTRKDRRRIYAEEKARTLARTVSSLAGRRGQVSLRVLKS